MRLSDILKSAESTSTVSTPIKINVQVPPPSIVETRLPEAMPPQGAPVARDEIHKETQEKLEREFQAKLKAFQEEARKSQEILLKSEEEKSFLRSEALKKEKQQLLAQLEHFKIQNEELLAACRNFEDFKKQMTDSQGNLVASLQARISEMEAQIQKTPLELPGEERKKIERQVREELDAAVRDKVYDLEHQIKERDQKIEAAEKKYARENELTPAPAALPKDLPIASPAASLDQETAAAVFTPELLREAQSVYEKLIYGARTLHQQSQSGAPLDTADFLKGLESLIQNSAHLQQEIMGIFFEAYPKQNYFVYHTVNCAVLSVFLGLELKMGTVELEELGLAAVLHDVGLMNVKDGSLDYPKQISPQMRDEIKRHPERGAEMIAPFVNENVRIAVLQHHELSNGKGYPKGLRGEEIHIYGKIINIADSFEALVHTRPYRAAAYDASEAVKEMIDRERGLYDRDVIKALLNLVGLYPIKSFVELNNKQIARVLYQNRQYPISPVIQIEFDEEGRAIQPPVVVDLSKNRLMHIIGPLRTTHSYTKAKLVKEKEKKERQSDFTSFLRTLLPLFLISGVLALLAYLVFKI